MLLQILQQARVIVDDDIRHALDALARQRGFGQFMNKRLEFALSLHLHRPSGNKKQIRDSIGEFNHRRQQFIEFFFIHDCA